MDYHDLQQKLFELDPSDPREDLAKLQQAAQGPAKDAAPAKDYVNESATVTEGSLPLGMDSIAEFAALAGVRLDEKQKHGDYARGKDKMPKAKAGRTDHPLKDKLVGEDDDKLNAFQRGVKSAQSGGWAPDSAENAIKGMFTGDKPKSDDKTDTKPAKGNTGATQAPAVAYKKFLGTYEDQLKVIAADPKKQKLFTDWYNKEIATESISNNKESIKERLMRELKSKGL